MTKAVSTKMGIKDGMRSIFLHAPEVAIQAIDLPKVDIKEQLRGDFDYIHLFVITEAAYRKEFPRAKKHLKPGGMLWVSWPKARQRDTDLTLPKIIEIGYDGGLVESINLRIDDTWAALKFTHPKKGKVYNNSHGTLKQ